MSYRIDHHHRERADNAGFSLVIALACFIALLFMGIALSTEEPRRNSNHAGILPALAWDFDIG